MDDIDRSNIRALVGTPHWNSLLKLVNILIDKRINIRTSMKRPTEYETVWGVAHSEGGRDFGFELVKEAEKIAYGEQTER